MMAAGVVVAASAGEHATASFWGEPLLCGSHAFAGGTPLRGAKPCVLGFCVRGVCVFCMTLVGSLLICFSAYGGVAGHWLGVSGPAVHWLCVSRAGGPLAWRVAGLQSTGSGCRGPAGHPDPALAGSSRMEIRARWALQDPALAGSPRKASFLPFHNNKYQ